MGKFGDPLLANQLSDPEISSMSKRLSVGSNSRRYQRTRSNTEKIVLERGPSQGARSSTKNSEQLNKNCHVPRCQATA